MDKKKLKFEVKAGNFEYNESFIVGEIPVCTHGFNRNMSHISKECGDNMFSKASYVPVVAEFKRRIDENGEEVSKVGSHGGRIIISDEGVKYEQTTIVVGCVLAEPYTMTDIDGEMHYTVKVALYKEKYPELTNIIENSTLNQSMEISVKDYTFKDGDDYLYIENANLEALCLLGEDVEPCFEKSQLKTEFAHSNDRFEFEYSEIVEKVKSMFEVDSTEEEKEEKEENQEEAVEEQPEGEEENQEDDSAKDDSEDFEEEKEKCELEDETEEDVEAEDEIEEETEEDVEEEEEDFSKEEYQSLIVEHTSLLEKFSTLQKEVEELREFKKSIEDEENKAEIDEICTQFDLEEEEYATLRDKAYSYEITKGELEDKLFGLVGRKLIKNKGFSKEKQINTVSKIKPVSSSQESVYGDLAKYLQK